MRAAIQIDSPNTPPAVAPGEPLRGRVGWEMPDAPELIELRLFYFTRGRGTRDVGVIDTQTWAAPGPSGTQDFEFGLPPGPHSCSGKLVAIIWALELVLQPSGHTERTEFVYSPDWREIDLGKYPVPEDLQKDTKVEKWAKRLKASEYDAE